MGDNLDFARDFTATAAEGLSLLGEMDDPCAPAARSVITAMMTQIQSGSKRLRARNIYQSAQDVLSAVHHDSSEILKGRIQSLGGLVLHYATGLADIEAQTGETSTRPLTVHGRWDDARRTLDALLPLAAPSDADSLSRLMRAGQPEATTRNDDFIETDIIAFPGLDRLIETQAEDMSPEIAAEPALESVPTLAPAPTMIEIRKPQTVETVQVALDGLMRDIVSDALATARQVGRTISLSYDMEDASICETLAPDLRARLGLAMNQIIRESLPEGRVGHIDINLAGEQLHIMAGTTALRVAIDPATVAAPAKPLINAATEQGLRAQLDALMDPTDLSIVS
jgi:uncharacterized membrane protein